MADLMEWYAADPGGYSPCYAPDPVLYSPYPNQAIYGRVVGIPGSVAWTSIWEPLSGGDSPNIYFSGPLDAGQEPIEPGAGGGPAAYTPADSNAVAAINFWELGILRLKAVVDGVPVPGELVITVSNGGGGYPSLALEYQTTGPGPTTFWVSHQNTYEIP